jgi:hypothetical protein
VRLHLGSIQHGTKPHNTQSRIPGHLWVILFQENLVIHPSNLPQHRVFIGGGAGQHHTMMMMMMIQVNMMMSMDQKRFLDWNTRVWTPFTQRPRASVYGSYMTMDEFKVHLMGSCLNAIQNNGTLLDAPTFWTRASLTHLKLMLVESLIIVC